MPAGRPAQDAPTPAASINPAVLDVNGDVIYATEISMVMRNIVSQLKAQNREVPPDNELVQMAMQRVVEQKLLAQEAKRRGYHPNDLRIAELVKSLEQQAGGREALDTSLANAGSSRERSIATITEMDLARTLIEKDIEPTITISDDEVAAFYDANPLMFKSPERAKVRDIFFAADESADPTIVTAARAKAEAARERALAGEDFVGLVHELSESPTAVEGGEIGFFTHDQVVPAFADAAFALEPGGISDVFRTEIGFHVIKLEEKRPAGTLSLDEASARARSILTQQKIGEKVQELIKTLIESAEIKPMVSPAPPTDATASQQAPE